MSYVRLYEKAEIETFLEQDVYLYLYGLGDLDDFFWPDTTWYGSRTGGKLTAVVLLYAGPKLPTLLGLSNDRPAMAELLRSIQHLIPNSFYAHLSPELEKVLPATKNIGKGTKHYKMGLLEESLIPGEDISKTVRLGSKDLPALLSLYKESYPENWFDPRMLETGQYFGIKEGEKLLSVAGVHVFSRRYKVAALGNITTRPEYRNLGYGTLVTAALCRSLLEAGMRIGLNVRADNEAAISCYRKIGFHITASYNEFTVG